jgi:hypothetical protein
MRMWIALIRVSIGGRISADQQEDGNEGARREDVLLCRPCMDSIHRWKQGWHQVQCICSVEYATCATAPLLSLTGKSKTKSQVRLSRAQEEYWMAPLYHQRRVTWRRIHLIYIIVRVCVRDSNLLRTILLMYTCTCPPCFILMACWNFMNILLHVIIP